MTKKGVIERVESLSETGKVGNIHYLPHQPVKRQDALTTKLRVVFNASSKGNLSLPSLNECVYVGPSMVPAIVDILLRFRSFKVGLAADIEKAFLNIGVKKEQRDLMRFLWVNDLKGEEPEIVVFRFKTVLFGMSCSPFCLNATLDYHIRKYMTTTYVLYKTFIRSSFNYCPLIWKFCGKTANNRINQLHKRALRVLQHDYTATFEDLLDKSEEVTVHCSNLQKLMIEIYERTNHIGPAVLTEFFTTKEIIYDLRIKNLLQIPKVKTSSYGQSSLSFRGSIFWNTFSDSIKSAQNIKGFKTMIKN